MLCTIIKFKLFIERKNNNMFNSLTIRIPLKQNAYESFNISYLNLK